MPATSQLTPRGRRTRSTLIAAARIVFERDGFIGARITDIAEEAGVAHGTFYTYFTTKEELFHEVAAEVLSQTDARPRPIEYDNLDQAIRGIVRSTQRYLQTYKRNAALMSVIEQVATFEPGMQAILTDRSVAYVARTEAHIVAVGALGVLPAGLDPYSAAVGLTSMVSRYARSVFGGNPSIKHRITFDQSVRTLSVLWASALGLVISSDVLDDELRPVGRRAKALS